ncbi:MAG TPA: ATP-binding protein [Polyangiaceae bacterium]|jgi:signal transduction histidine kinase/ActR/RegA family two-component response regulator|nr:ATP-binding protein [Polyangiaceae bacterium]
MLFRLLLAVTPLGLFAGIASLLDPRNDVSVTIVFYAAIFTWLLVVYCVARTGLINLAAWVFSLFFWIVIAFVTLVFGGLQGQFASTFAVCTLLIGSIVGGRAALGMAVASALWCAFVAYLEYHGLLPKQLGPYSAVNAWAAATVTVILTAVLLQTSLLSLKRAHAEAQKAANERDEALRRSIQGQKMELVGNLTSGIAHDLNNLLTVILAVSDSLKRQGPHEEDPKVLLDELEGATTRAGLLTRQVLTFARLGTNEVETVDASAIVEEMGRMLPRLLGRTHTFEVNTQPDCLISASRVGIEQILLNLAVNARDAMPKGGKFTLSVKGRNSQVVLTAEDTGAGMSDEVKARIFEPFFTTKSTGTGLGLATVKQLIDRYGGSVEVESEVGNGTRLLLSFPRVRRPQEAAQERGTGASQETEAAPNSRPRILLVEDDPIVQRTLQRLLEKAGYSVTMVEDGAAALAALERLRSIHCVVSDVAMPGMDGEQLAQRLEQTQPNLPLVLMSGNRQPTAALKPHLPRTFLMKPVGSNELRSAIDKVVEHARSLETVPSA